MRRQVKCRTCNGRGYIEIDCPRCAALRRIGKKEERCLEIGCRQGKIRKPCPDGRCEKGFIWEEVKEPYAW